MSWTTPATWSVGESPTAAKLNTHVRDNLSWLHDSAPAVRLYASGAQTISNDSWTAISFDSELVDNDSMHSGGTPTRITFTTAGVYAIQATAPFFAIGSPVGLGVRISTNALGPVFETIGIGCSQDFNGPSISGIVPFNAADYMELEVWQNSGGNLDTVSGVSGLSFSAYRVAA